MSISSAANRNDYVGTSALHVYAYSFKIFTGAETDLLVTVRHPTTGVETTLTYLTDYTVSGAGSASGGNVTLVNASQAWLTSGELTTSWHLTIRRVRPVTQVTDIRNQGDYFPETIEDQMDSEVMIDQQQQDLIGRSVKLPETITPSVFNPQLPKLMASYPGSALVVNSTGDGFDLAASSGVLVSLVFKADTMANLFALAAAAPTTMRMGYATDSRTWMFYTGDVTVGQTGWLMGPGG